ncbi:MAG TPA: GNAT family N-acetyltransferase [Jatrophihabitans sp.]|nr:GNAT family N-acetyltransferase [Jatrophihabitans sp.]
MTSATEIRHVPFDEIVPWLRAMRSTLLENPAAGGEHTLPWWKDVWDPERVFGGYAEGRCVATLRTFPTTLTIPSGPAECAELPIDALTQVTVAATHRRRGLLTRMLTQSLADAKERGEVASLLLAAEWAIYGRFGYWPAVMSSNYRILSMRRPRILPPRQAHQLIGVDPEQLLEPAAEVHRRVRLQRPGHIDRTTADWQRRLGLRGLRPPGTREPVCVLARNADGRVDGYAMWRATNGDFFTEPDQMQVTVDEVLAATEDAYRALWQYLLGLDLVRVLLLRAYPVDEPLEWLLSDGRAAQRTLTGDRDWLRLLDVPAALSARRYACTDRLVLDVVDDDGGWAAGRFTLDGGPTHAECRPTPAATADLRLSQRALAGIYLGGNTVRAQQLAGLVDEETPGAAARLEAMFWTAQQPWNATPF